MVRVFFKDLVDVKTLWNDYRNDYRIYRLLETTIESTIEFFGRATIETIESTVEKNTSGTQYHSQYLYLKM